MATIKTWKDLEKALKQARDKALEGTGEKAKELVKDEIQKEVYDIPEGSYERTHDLMTSLTDHELEVKGNTAQVEISHDWWEMSRDTSKFQHASPYWSPWDYRRYIAETVHYGTSGSLFGSDSSLHWRQPKPYMDNAKDRLSKGEYKKFMMEMLRKDGFKVE